MRYALLQPARILLLIPGDPDTGRALEELGAFRVGDGVWAVLPGFEKPILGDPRVRRVEEVEVEAPRDWVKRLVVASLNRSRGRASELLVAQLEALREGLTRPKPIVALTSKRYVNVKVSGELPIYSRARTHTELTVYGGLEVRVYRGRRYLVASIVPTRTYREEKENRLITSAPEGSIVLLFHSSGSGKHIYFLYRSLFLAREGARATVTLPNEMDEEGKPGVVLEVEGLTPLGKPTLEERAAVEGEIRSMNLIPSDRDPVIDLYYWWVKRAVAPGFVKVSLPRGESEERGVRA